MRLILIIWRYRLLKKTDRELFQEGIDERYTEPDFC